MAYSHVGDWSTAEDIAQETFLVAFSNLKKLRVPKAFSFWIQRIVRNLCAHWRRSESYRHRLAEHMARTKEELTNQPKDPSTMIEAQERTSEVWGAISKLSPRVREAMVLYYVKGNSTAEAARVLGIAEGTLKSRLFEGRRKVRDILLDRVESELKEGLSKDLDKRIFVALPLGPALPEIGRAVSTGSLGFWAKQACQRDTSVFLKPALYGGANTVMKTTIILAAIAALIGGSVYVTLGSREEIAPAELQETQFDSSPSLPGGSAESPLTPSTGVSGDEPVTIAQLLQEAGANQEPGSKVEQSLGEISSQELVRNYKRILAQQEKFTFKFKCQADINSEYEPQPWMADITGRRTEYSSGELASNGHRAALRMKIWGQRGGPQNFFPANNPFYVRVTFDGVEHWDYILNPFNKVYPGGKLGIWSPRREQVSEITGLAYPGRFLLGYISRFGFKMDMILDEADSLVVRDAPEKVGDSECYVLDVKSQYGRGTLWFDPQHGYNVAMAEFNVRTGDTVFNGILSPGNDSWLYLREVSFKEIDGVWFPTGGTVATQLREPIGRENRTEKHEISDIRLNPDLDMLGVFSTDDIREGARVVYIGVSGEYSWQGGEIVPAADR